MEQWPQIHTKFYFLPSVYMYHLVLWEKRVWWVKHWCCPWCWAGGAHGKSCGEEKVDSEICPFHCSGILLLERRWDVGLLPWSFDLYLFLKRYSNTAATILQQAFFLPHSASRNGLWLLIAYLLFPHCLSKILDAGPGKNYFPIYI